MERGRSSDRDRKPLHDVDKLHGQFSISASEKKRRNGLCLLSIVAQ